MRLDWFKRQVKEMVSNDLGKVLHDKATLGEPLSDEEQAQLESWYELQDSLESDILRKTPDEKAVATLQTQIDTALSQLMTITKRIQEISGENEALRQEIISLRRQLVDSATLQQAA